MRMSKRVRVLWVWGLFVIVVVVGMPTTPTFAEPCPGNTNDAFGPCSDPGTWIVTGGDGYCGACSDEVRTYVGGACAGGTAGEGAFDCNDCTKVPKTILQNYSSTPAGSAEVFACFLVWEACIAADIAASLAGGIGCAAACGLFYPPGSPYCAGFCGGFIAINGAELCECLYDECIETCDPVGNPVQNSTASSCA